MNAIHSLHIMSGKIPDHEESQKAGLLKQMEDTYIKNLTDAVPRLEKVIYRYVL